MLPEGSHVRTVYLNPDTGVLEADLTNKTLMTKTNSLEK